MGKTKPPTTTLDRLRATKDLKGVRDTSWDDLIKSIEGEGEVLDATQLGEGFHLLQGKDDKKKLVGQPLVIVDWVVNPGKFGGFITLKVKTQHPVMFDGEGYQHFILNDGGTGISRQINDIVDAGFRGMIVCRRGLRVSEDYEVMMPDPTDPKKKVPVTDPATGKPVLGTTFYIDTSL